MPPADAGDDSPAELSSVSKSLPARSVVAIGRGGATNGPTVRAHNSLSTFCRSRGPAFPKDRRYRKGCRDFLKERFIAPVIVDLRADARGFFLHTKLRRGIEHAANPLFRQISQRRLASSRP